MSEQQRQSVVAMTYGPPKVGKSTDLGFSFPKALFLAAPGALSSIESTCGYRPDQTPVGTIPEATKVVDQLGADKSRKYKTLVIDDFSFMAEQTMSAVEKKYKGWKMWGKLREIVLEFRNKSRYAGINVILNAWEQGPKWKKNEETGQVTFHRGGPQLSGNLPEAVPALCDVVLRVGHEPDRSLWPYVYLCRPDPNYVMGDRTNVAVRMDPAPMNLGEILRARGHSFERLYPDQEELVEKLVTPRGSEPALLTGDLKVDRPNAQALFLQLLDSGMDESKARWTLRDALDRALIRRTMALQKRSLFPVQKQQGLR